MPLAKHPTKQQHRKMSPIDAVLKCIYFHFISTWKLIWLQIFINECKKQHLKRTPDDLPHEENMNYYYSTILITPNTTVQGIIFWTHLKYEEVRSLTVYSKISVLFTMFQKNNHWLLQSKCSTTKILAKYFCHQFIFEESNNFASAYVFYTDTFYLQMGINL
jgi:hypothetical protein